MTNTTLARRLDQHPRFRWMAGMLARNPANGDLLRVIDADQYGVYCERYEFNLDELEFAGLDDWASLGCLWRLLCEALPEDWGVLMGRNGLVETYDDVRGRHDHASVPETLLFVWERTDD